MFDFIEQSFGSVGVHYAFDGIDRVVVFGAPHRAHWATKIAFRGVVDQHPFGQFGNRKRLPVEFRFERNFYSR